MKETCWSTAGVPATERRDFWRDTVRGAINDVDIRIENSETFRASLRQRRLGPLSLSHIDVHGTQVVRRPRSLIERCDTELFSVIHLLDGQGWLRHRGREVGFSRDECIIVDNREPYEIAIVGRGESLSIHMPAGWLADHVQDIGHAVAMPLSRSRPWARQLMDLMATAHSLGEVEAAPELFAEHFAATLALAVDGLGEGAAPRARNAFHALQATLAELASSPNLRVQEVADAHRISVRQVHHVYAAQGTTFGRELMRVRLERAHALLANARFRSLSVEEIGRR